MKKNWLSIIAFLSVAVPFKAQNLPETENYIYSRVYLEPVTTPSSTAKQAQEVTYFDGLGRPKQNISIKTTPSGKDIVIPIEYDAFGRQVKDMLPLPQQITNNGGIFISPDMAGAVSVYGNASNYYGEKKIENSPLARLEEQAAPGEPWKMGSGKTIKYTYQTNISSEVKKFMVNTTWTMVSGVAVGTPTLKISAENTTYTSGGFYKAGTLNKNTVTDEDGNAAVTYTDSKGQVVLMRKNDGEQNADTYYAYNEYGQLAYVIPPLVVKAIESAGNTITTAILDNLCYQYRYDNQDRLVEKKFPGKDWEFMVYDQQDRLVLMQDANLRTTTNNFAAKGWLFTKYDQFGRVVYTGFFSNTATRQVMQNTLDTMTVNAQNNEKRNDQSPIDQGGENIYYTKNAFPTEGMIILSVNYYDTYPPMPTNAISRPDIILGQKTLNPVTAFISVNGITTSRSTKGLPTATYVRNIEDTSWTKNYFWYDTKGRKIGSYSINHLGGYTKTESLLDFAGVPQQTITRHKRLAADTEKVITETFTYDSQNRLLVHKHKVDNNAEEILTQNTYNEISQLTNKKVGGTVASNPLQNIDYQYNIRGWLTKINDPSAALTGGKLFGYEIKYINPANTTYAIARYNGNIAEVDWRTSNDNVLRRYSYSYDSLNRLNYGHYAEPGTTQPLEDYFGESIEYDLNGNITRLYRNAKNTTNGMAMQVDNLTYAYTGNRLNTVTDTSQNYAGYPDVSGNTISYDNNGNMTSHKDKGILQIDYNYLNLPGKLIFDRIYIVRDQFSGSPETRNITTQYLYRADGRKLSKVYTYGISKSSSEAYTLTDYLDGFQYEGQGTSTKVARILKFVPTTEGYYNFENNKYIYNYVDHLGDIRLSYMNNGTGAQIIEENNYYPFGLRHQGYNGSPGNPSYQYKYNGKELQTESGMYDYGARFYMPDLGRWGVVDPAAEYLPEYSPYTFTFNDPIGFVDNDGKFPGPTGAVIGILADYIGQVAGHYFFDNMSFKDSMIKDINYWSLGISGVTGALTGGIDSFKSTLTSGVGKKIFVNMIDYGVDVLVNTVGGVMADQLDEGEFDVWKSLTGGLIEAGVGRVIPLKYVDKLEKKLLHKMNVNANKAAKIKSKLGNVTRKKTIRKLEAKLQVAENNVVNYTSAYTGVKTVNDVFKKTGVNGLTDQLFKKDEQPKKGKLEVGELISEGTEK